MSYNGSGGGMGWMGGMSNSSTPIVNGFQLQASTQAPLHLAGSTPHYIVRDGDYLDVFNTSYRSGTPTRTLFSNVTSITVDPASLPICTLTIDLSAGDALPDGGLNYNGGPFQAPLKIVGNTGSDSVGLFSNEVDLNVGTILYSNVSNIFLDPNGGVDSIGAYSGNLILAPQTPNTGVVAWQFSDLVIYAGASLTAGNPTSPANRHVLVTGYLYIDSDANGPTAQLDLTGNDLIVTGADQTAVRTELISGLNNGTWNGNGISSSMASFDAGHLTTLGTLAFTATGTFDGQSVAAGDVAIKYGYYGDANFDGHVDASDYSKIDSGFVQHLTTYTNGDFNLDGIINGSDYTLIDNTFNRQGAVLAIEVASPRVAASFLVLGSPARRAYEMPAVELNANTKSAIDTLLDSWEMR